MPAAHCYASTITTFKLTATLLIGSLDGTISIDVTNGLVAAADISAPGTFTGPFTKIAYQTNNGYGLDLIDIDDSSSGPDILYLYFPLYPLVNYNGGQLCSESYVCAHPFSSVPSMLVVPGVYIDTMVTGVTTVAPVPAALPLFATGLGGLGLLGWRRKRKAPFDEKGRCDVRKCRLSNFVLKRRALAHPRLERGAGAI